MKKTYKNPTLTVVNIQTAQILNGSPDPKFNPNSSTNTMEARRGRFTGRNEEEW